MITWCARGHTYQALWCTPVIPAVGKCGQQDQFKGIHGSPSRWDAQNLWYNAKQYQNKQNQTATAKSKNKPTEVQKAAPQRTKQRNSLTTPPRTPPGQSLVVACFLPRSSLPSHGPQKASLHLGRFLPTQSSLQAESTSSTPTASVITHLGMTHSPDPSSELLTQKFDCLFDVSFGVDQTQQLKICIRHTSYSSTTPRPPLWGSIFCHHPLIVSPVM